MLISSLLKIVVHPKKKKKRGFMLLSRQLNCKVVLINPCFDHICASYLLLLCTTAQPQPLLCRIEYPAGHVA